MKFSHALLLLLGSLMIIQSNCRNQDVLIYDDFYLYSYYPVTPLIYTDLGCFDSLFSTVCAFPLRFYELWRKDNNKFNDIKLRLDEKAPQKHNLASNLTSELKAIKKEILGDESKSLSEMRQNAFTTSSLLKQMQLNRLRELEKFISEKQNTSN